MGDFNNLNISDILCHHNLNQVVDTPTHATNTLDLIITSLQEFYYTAIVMAPLGLSDHCIIKWVPANNEERTGNKSIKRKICRFPQSSCVAFRRWYSSHNWFADVKETTSASMLANSFTEEMIIHDHIFRIQTVKIHHTDKQWMTPNFKNLVKTESFPLWQQRSLASLSY